MNKEERNSQEQYIVSREAFRDMFTTWDNEYNIPAADHWYDENYDQIQKEVNELLCNILMKRQLKSIKAQLDSVIEDNFIKSK